MRLVIPNAVRNLLFGLPAPHRKQIPRVARNDYARETELILCRLRLRVKGILYVTDTGTGRDTAMKTVVLVSCIALASALVLALSPVARAEQADTAKIINLELKDTPIKEAIDSLFKGTGLKYYVQPGVSGKVVELKLKGITLDQALDALAEAAQLTYKVEDGAYIICPAPKNAQAAGLSPPRPKPRVQPAMPAEQPGMGPSRQPPPAQTGALAGASVGNNSAQVNITNPPPSYYGNPGPYGGYGANGGGGGYGGLPYYQVGSLGILGGGWGSGPVVVAGGNPYIIERMPMPPPPPGWVGPDLLRFLRTQYAIQNRTFITYNGY